MKLNVALTGQCPVLVFEPTPIVIMERDPRRSAVRLKEQVYIPASVTLEQMKNGRYRITAVIPTHIYGTEEFVTNRYVAVCESVRTAETKDNTDVIWHNIYLDSPGAEVWLSAAQEPRAWGTLHVWIKWQEPKPDNKVSDYIYLDEASQQAIRELYESLSAATAVANNQGDPNDNN
jgi:hypothetical protein